MRGCVGVWRCVCIIPTLTLFQDLLCDTFGRLLLRWHTMHATHSIEGGTSSAVFQDKVGQVRVMM